EGIRRVLEELWCHGSRASFYSGNAGHGIGIGGIGSERDFPAIEESVSIPVDSHADSGARWNAQVRDRLPCLVGKRAESVRVDRALRVVIAHEGPARHVDVAALHAIEKRVR